MELHSENLYLPKIKIRIKMEDRRVRPYIVNDLIIDYSINTSHSRRPKEASVISHGKLCEISLLLE